MSRCSLPSAGDLVLLQLTQHDLIPPHLNESLISDIFPTMPEQVISEPDSCANIASCGLCIIAAL
ncbi:hypothetical protein GBS27_21410 [Escherichia coli]|nr:hypothetical protein [Escherichia coli]RIG33734.1 hypothetical protein CUA56_20520 [Shigella boydii]EAA5676551.1 hypothetical protein [Escherichia coli]EAB9602394.1 hypothetical protein [Escherichia coli]EEX2547448.1 hypothetical protein [Escherichia coli]